jgi:plasmid stability protein
LNDPAVWGGEAMASVTVKNVPEDIYEKLKQRAKANQRSMNAEVIACLQETVGSGRFDPEKLLARIEALHSRISSPLLTDRLLRRARAGADRGRWPVPGRKSGAIEKH